jgi:hypothetical protein
MADDLGTHRVGVGFPLGAKVRTEAVPGVGEHQAIVVAKTLLQRHAQGEVASHQAGFVEAQTHGDQGGFRGQREGVEGSVHPKTPRLSVERHSEGLGEGRLLPRDRAPRGGAAHTQAEGTTRSSERSEPGAAVRGRQGGRRVA